MTTPIDNVVTHQRQIIHLGQVRFSTLVTALDEANTGGSIKLTGRVQAALLATAQWLFVESLTGSADATKQVSEWERTIRQDEAAKQWAIYAKGEYPWLDIKTP